MGIFTKQHCGLGVELNESSARTVLLEDIRGHLVVSHALCLSRRQEGFLNGREMRMALAEWLEDQDLKQYPAAGNLSQNLTLEAVYDFPREATRRSLRKLVDFQTQSLCGITDENFTCGAQQLTQRKDQPKRMLIAASREQIAEQTYQDLAETGGNIKILVENGQALTNAFVNLHPGDFQKDSLQILLHLDKSSASCVLFKGGQLLQITGLTVGGDSLLNCLRQLLRCDDYQAEKEMDTFQPDWQDPQSPFRQTLYSMVNEVKSVLLHWRQTSSHTEETGSILTKVWLTGDCTLLPGLAEEMSKLLLCSVVRFGVPARMLKNANVKCPPDLDCHPSLSLAYGLALQAMDRSMLKISLLPTSQQKKLRHINDFPYLCGAVTCVLALLTTLLLAWSLEINRKIQRLDNRKAELLQCKEIIPEIESLHQKLQIRYQRMQPLLEYGRRNHLFVQALVNCQRVLKEPLPNNLTVRGIYLADEFSFEQEHGKLTDILPETEEIKQGKTVFPLPSSPSAMCSPHGTTIKGRGQQASQICGVDDLPRLEKMYLGGITEQNETRFETLKKIQETFSQEHLFANVDDYTDFFRENYPKDSPQSWRYFFQDKHQRLTSSYTLFLLQLPFQEKISK